MDRAEKAQTIDALKAEFTAHPLVVVAHYTGLTVAELTDLRRRMRKADAGLQVTKNRLARIAIKDTDHATLDGLFRGPTAIALSRDPVEGSALCDQGVVLAKKVAASESLSASTLHRLRIALVRDDLVQTKILSEQCRAEAHLHRTPLYKFEAKALLTLADDRLS